MAGSKEDSQQNEREAIKEDLLAQLERAGEKGACFQDQINDYMSFWDAKEALRADILLRGHKITKRDSKGQAQLVTNESIDQSIKINAQMLKILSELGIKPASGGGCDDPDL